VGSGSIMVKVPRESTARYNPFSDISNNYHQAYKTNTWSKVQLLHGFTIVCRCMLIFVVLMYC
jgi:hypothetical protein